MSIKAFNLGLFNDAQYLFINDGGITEFLSI